MYSGNCRLGQHPDCLVGKVESWKHPLPGKSLLGLVSTVFSAQFPRGQRDRCVID